MRAGSLRRSRKVAANGPYGPRGNTRERKVSLCVAGRTKHLEARKVCGAKNTSQASASSVAPLRLVNEIE